MKTLTLIFDKNAAKHILGYDLDCGSCHEHKFVESNRPMSRKPRFNCPYNKRFRKKLQDHFAL